jgi:hypothetical protein
MDNKPIQRIDISVAHESKPEELSDPLSASLRKR